MDIQIIPIDSITPHPRNAAYHPHPDAQVQDLAESARQFDQVKNIVVWNGLIIAGTGFWLGMKAAGQTQIAVKDMSHWPEHKALAFMAMDNELPKQAPTDDEELLTLVAELSQEDEELAKLAAGSDERFRELLRLLDDTPPAGEDSGPQEDKATELQAKWQTALGQLWLIPSKSIHGHAHRLLIGDSTKTDDVRRVMNGERAVLFSTDPPYLVNYDGTNHPGSSKNWGETYHDWDGDEKGEQFYHDFISLAIREAITDHAAWYCWHASVRQAMLERVWQEHGAFVHQQILWKKDRGVLTHSWYLWQHECCFLGWIRGNKPRRVSNESHGTIWEAPVPNAPGQETLHPTSKPTLLFEIPMEQHLQPGEICFEPFAGSGSQFVAGEKLGRLIYGLEIQPQYAAVVLERLAGMGLKPELSEVTLPEQG